MKRVYHFLGSIQFAILLIALTALFVAAGTFLEAQSDSHLYSASLTYQNPVFLALIWGFFINILFSALRRWPFQSKHIPFLTTHLGLLMLLSGVIIKSYWGTQGSMSVIEGGTSHRIFLPNTYSLLVEKKDPSKPSGKNQSTFVFDQWMKRKVSFDDVEIRLVDYSGHSYEHKQTWIKGPQAIISGLNPIPVIHYPSDEKILPEGYKVHFHHDESQPWKILAIKTPQVAEAAKEFYLQGLIVQISDTKTGSILSKMPLNEVLGGGIKEGDYQLLFSLDWNFASPLLTVDVNGEKIAISLSGPDSLINKNISNPHRGKIPLTFDLERDPAILMVQDDQEDDHLFFFNPHGEIHAAAFKNDQLQSLVVYDDGFGGYAVQTAFPFDDFPSSRKDKEQAELLRLAVHLRRSLEKNPNLSPPLQMLKKSAEKNKTDFASATLNFLHVWDASSQLLLETFANDRLHPIVQRLDWDQIPEMEQYACGWLCQLLDEMEEQMKEGKSFVKILKERGWPFVRQFAEMDPQDIDSMITLFSQQMIAASAQLPPPNIMPGTISAKALSAYLRAYGITLDNIRQSVDSPAVLRQYHAARVYNDSVRKILSPLEKQPAKVLAKLIHSMPEDSRLLEEIKKAYAYYQKHVRVPDINILPQPLEMGQVLIDYAPLDETFLSLEESKALSASLNSKEIVLETPLTLSQSKIPALKKWEDNYPLATLEIRKGKVKEYFTLTYDKYGTGLAWPILNGDYTLRFQPLFLEIPYKIRLHDARQINYPGTNQPYSYESDIIVTDKRDQSKVEKTISMNNVHETDDGYRFYLASLSPPQEVAPQRVQIVVNHDPAKYILTYPGAIILTLGIVLLFWMRPYKK
jgi:hypothetical protein